LQISVARFFQNELEVAGVLKRLRIAAALQSNLSEPANWLWLPNARKSGSNTARFNMLADALPL